MCACIITGYEHGGIKITSFSFTLTKLYKLVSFLDADNAYGYHPKEQQPKNNLCSNLRFPECYQQLQIILVSRKIRNLQNNMLNFTSNDKTDGSKYVKGDLAARQQYLHSNHVLWKTHLPPESKEKSHQLWQTHQLCT